MTPVGSLRCYHLSHRLFSPPASNWIILQDIVQVLAWFSSQTFVNVLVLTRWLFSRIQQKSSTLKNSCTSPQIHVSNRAQLFLINSLIEPHIEVIVLSPPLRCCSDVQPGLAQIDGSCFNYPKPLLLLFTHPLVSAFWKCCNLALVEIWIISGVCVTTLTPRINDMSHINMHAAGCTSVLIALLLSMNEPVSGNQWRELWGFVLFQM